MDPVNPKLYNEFISIALDQKKIHPSMRSILQEKIQEISKFALGQKIEPTSQDAQMAVSLMPELKGDDTKTAVIAASHFNFAYAKSLEYEQALFSVEAPSPIALVPVPSGKKNLPYTLLTHVARPLPDVINCVKVFKAEKVIRNYLPLTPQRLLLHKITVKLVSGYQVPSSEFEDKIQKLTPKLLEAFNKENPQIVKESESLRADIERDVRKALEAGTTSGLTSGLQELVNKLIEQTTGNQSSKEEVDLAIAQRAADIVVDNSLFMKVDQFKFENTALVRELTPLTLQTDDNRRMYMINGGVASGKGTATSQLIKEAEREGVEWKDVVMLNIDAYKPLLLDPSTLSSENKPFFSGLAHDEASLIRDAIFNQYQKKLETGKAPHLFVDQNWPAEDVFNLGGASKRGVDVTIVQIPVKHSFRMAYSRGTETDRYEARTSILQTHKNVPRQLRTSIDSATRQGNTNIRIKYIENVAVGKVREVASFDYKDKTGKVDNLDGFLGFFKKTGLDTNAKTFATLYPDESSKDLNNYVGFAGSITSKCNQEIPIYENGQQIGTLTENTIR